MIGYYIHHRGNGHVTRATRIAAHIGTTVTGLSSLPRPDGWDGPWIQLPRDDEGTDPLDIDAGGRLHWAPEHDAGLRVRTAEISEWIAAVDPDVMVVDVSVEVALLARLHGVPVVTFVLPGDRRDPAHELVHGIARQMVATWPDGTRGMVRGIEDDEPRLVRVGAISRFDDRIGTADLVASGRRRRVTLLMGSGGTDLTADDLSVAETQTPDWDWTILDPTLGMWTEDPWEALTSADVVVTHAGQNAVAEVAAARRPAVVIPQTRPHHEQDATAAALGLGNRWPTVVVGGFPATGWAGLLEEAAGLDGQRWVAWNDGHGAERAADLIEEHVRHREAHRGQWAGEIT